MTTPHTDPPPKGAAALPPALTATLNLASGQALALREALNALLSIQGTVEVLGEWEALDINTTYRKRDRAKVETVNAQCRAALTQPAPPVVPRALAEELAEALRLLYDNQNGCPLPKYETDWNEAMRLSGAALAKWEAAE